MTTPDQSLLALLKKYNLRPRKGLGQNFLTDPTHLSKIVAAAELDPTDTVLEIGPGPGIMTRRLAEIAKRVIAVELDWQMVGLLRAEYGHQANLTIVEADILKTEIGALLPGALPDRRHFKVVANLPYYITSAVIRHLLEADPQPARLVLMVQKEVAQRIVARPGQMSLLAVSVQFYGRPSLVHTVPAGAFFPPPKVDSAVVRIDTFEQPPVAVTDINFFFRVVKAGFSQKRKQLKNSVSGGLAAPAAVINAALNQANIDPTRRAESLSLPEWGRLVEMLTAETSG
ncbi:MAG: 16S rRNA (adenine(1518)-N(6)/adenine(1519)-N(6))-dimethyltransferase RsmA [Anaerolineae bacterium]|nr:16S rRNA (adenine(1518)-N(6)/adenine(1519)-N(6))-dimethyltransferase RsmA [Anaerolineae bacterium]